MTLGVTLEVTWAIARFWVFDEERYNCLYYNYNTQSGFFTILSDDVGAIG